MALDETLVVSCLDSSSETPPILQAFQEVSTDVLQPPSLPFEASSLSTEALRCNLAAYRASAQAASRVLQSLLLLISYLCDMQVLGTTSSAQEEMSNLASVTAPQVETLEKPIGLSP